MEDLAGGSPEGSVNVDVERSVHLLDVQLLPLHATRPEGIEVAVKNESSTIFKVKKYFRHYSTCFLGPETSRLILGAAHLLNN